MFTTAEERRAAHRPFAANAAGFLLAATSTFILAAPAYSATVSYTLDQSNALTDGVPYLQVTIADGADGAVDFKVQVLPALTSLAGSNFGIDKFALNVAAGTSASAINVTGLPSGWSVSNGGRMDGFGLFDLQLKGTGNSRQTELDFSITGVSLDQVLSYVDLSTGQASQGHVDFAAHVAGFTTPGGSTNSSGVGSGLTHASAVAPLKLGQKFSQANPKWVQAYCDSGHGSGGGQGEHEGYGGHGGNHGSGGGDGATTSAFFGGSMAVVPVPAAAWLFASGLALLAPVRRRQR